MIFHARLPRCKCPTGTAGVVSSGQFTLSVLPAPAHWMERNSMMVVKNEPGVSPKRNRPLALGDAIHNSASSLSDWQPGGRKEG